MPRVVLENNCGSPVCEEWEVWATAILTSMSNLAIVPALVVIYRRQLRFEVAIAILGLVSSFFYHFCEPTGVLIYGMNGGNWHRLDNIGAIMCFVNLFIYFMDNRNNVFNDYLKYAALCWTLIQQESGPWVLSNTLIPILAAASLPFVKFIAVRRFPDYNWRNFWLGWFLMLLAFAFFARGLEDTTDYLRAYHSMWHGFVGLASYFLWQTVPKRNLDRDL